MFRYIALGYICLLLSLVGCDFSHEEIDEELVKLELIELSDDIQAGSIPLRTWDVLMRLGQVSFDTRFFLSHMQEYSIPQIIPHRISEFIERMQAQMAINRLGHIELLGIERAMLPENRMIDAEGITAIIQNESENSRKQ